jgi:hypothetical protein
MTDKVNLGRELTDEELMDMIGGFDTVGDYGTPAPLYGIKPTPTPRVMPLYGIKTPTPKPTATPRIAPLYGVRTPTPPRVLYGIFPSPTPKPTL